MTKSNSTAIVAVLDRSSSMSPLAEETIKGFNAFLAKQKEEPGEAVITVATFSHDYTLLHDSVPLDVDHNHITNKVRGLLCNNCNRGLGHFKENINFLESAKQYLENEMKNL